MQKKMDYMLLIVGTIIKFLISLLITNITISFVYSFIFLSIYIIMLARKSNVEKYVPFIMLDFISAFYLCYLSYRLGAFMIAISLIYFMFSSFVIYFAIFESLVRERPISIHSLANIEIDRGIKALEDKDYDLALEAFSKVIKEHRENYLGYMGMCTTLSKMDKKNLKKIEYYRKKYIKYAPRELRESITNKYD